MVKTKKLGMCKELRIHFEIDTYVAIYISFVQCFVCGKFFLHVPDANRVVTRACDKTIGWHGTDRFGSCGIHFHAPDAGRVIEKRMRFSHPPNISDIPNVETVIVVDAGQLVVLFVKRQSYRVRVPRVWWMLRHVTKIQIFN